MLQKFIYSAYLKSPVYVCDFWHKTNIYVSDEWLRLVRESKNETAKVLDYISLAINFKLVE